MTQAELIAKVSKEIERPGCTKEEINEFAAWLIEVENIIDVIPDEREGVLKHVDASGNTTFNLVLV